MQVNGDDIQECLLEELSEQTKSSSESINIQLRERRWGGTDISALDGDLLFLCCNLYS